MPRPECISAFQLNGMASSLILKPSTMGNMHTYSHTLLTWLSTLVLMVVILPTGANARQNRYFSLSKTVNIYCTWILSYMYHLPCAQAEDPVPCFSFSFFFFCSSGPALSYHRSSGRPCMCACWQIAVWFAMGVSALSHAALGEQLINKRITVDWVSLYGERL